VLQGESIAIARIFTALGWFVVERIISPRLGAWQDDGSDVSERLAAQLTTMERAGRFLITQDLDFSDARAFAPGTHHGILLVRLPQPGRTTRSERVATLVRGEDVDSWAGCLVTAALRKVRVKRTP